MQAVRTAQVGAEVHGYDMMGDWGYHTYGATVHEPIVISAVLRQFVIIIYI